MKNVVSMPAVLSAQMCRPCVFTMSFVIGRPRSTP